MEKEDAALRQLFADCTLCPRSCHVNRLAGQTGYCGQTAQIRAARAALHYWEEPCISGTAGSGAVFFSGCTMRCVFCQNHEIAAGRAGKEIRGERLAEIFLELQAKGANNINLVTATHFVPAIVPALERAKRHGLNIPVVYNTSSYEKVSTLKLLDGLVDIYLPDFKYVSRELSGCLSSAPDYFETAAAAVEEMVRQVGEPLFEAADGTVLTAGQMNDMCTDDGGDMPDSEFLMKKGVIVRHLALPGQEEDSRRVLRYLFKTFGNRIYISLMNQYTPMPDFVRSIRKAEEVGKSPDLGGAERQDMVSDRERVFQGLAEKLSEEAYGRLIDFALDEGIENGFIQDGETAQESFIPAFDGEGL